MSGTTRRIGDEMRIGEVAAAAGVSPRALRYYEEHGLVESARSPGGQRIYGSDVVGRVRWIQDLYAAGLSSAAVQRLLPCLRTGSVSEEVLAELQAHRTDVEGRIRALTTTRDRLDTMMDVARRHSVGRDQAAAG